MFDEFDRGEEQHSRVSPRLRTIVIFLTVASVYALLLVAGTAHMSAAEREAALLPQKGLGLPMMRLSVRMGERVCDFDEVFVGDRVMRVGSRCVLQRGATNRERKEN